MKGVFRDISYSFLANVISLIVGAFSVLVFPKYLGQEEFGYYQLYLFYMTYTIITSLGWSDGVYLKIGGKKYDELNYDQIATQFWMMIIVQIGIYVALDVMLPESTDCEKKKIIAVVCFGAIIVQARYFLYLILQATNRIKEYACIVITERVISVPLGVVAILFGYRDYYALIVLDVLGRFVSLLIAIGFCKSIFFRRPRISASALNDSVKYMISGSGVLFSGLASTIIVGIGRYFIEYNWDIVMFSKVSLAISVSNMVVRCINSIGIVMFPKLRNTRNDELKQIYIKVNSVLMAFVFGALIFYQPAVSIMSAWIPDYIDSFRYAAILLPVCVYECKNALLISPYMKTLNKGKELLVINIVPVVSIAIGAFVSCVVLNSVELTIVFMLISIVLRSCIGELYLFKLMKINDLRSIWYELALVIAFVVCSWYFGWRGFIGYICCYIIFFKSMIKNNSLTKNDMKLV